MYTYLAGHIVDRSYSSNCIQSLVDHPWVVTRQAMILALGLKKESWLHMQWRLMSSILSNSCSRTVRPWESLWRAASWLSKSCSFWVESLWASGTASFCCIVCNQFAYIETYCTYSLDMFKPIASVCQMYSNVASNLDAFRDFAVPSRLSRQAGHPGWYLSLGDWSSWVLGSCTQPGRTVGIRLGPASFRQGIASPHHYWWPNATQGSLANPEGWKQEICHWWGTFR